MFTVPALKGFVLACSAFSASLPVFHQPLPDITPFPATGKVMEAPLAEKITEAPQLALLSGVSAQERTAIEVLP